MNYGVTGEPCRLPGRYRCFGRPDVKISLSIGQSFPTDAAGQPAYWILVSAPNEKPRFHHPKQPVQRPDCSN